MFRCSTQFFWLKERLADVTTKEFRGVFFFNNLYLIDCFVQRIRVLGNRGAFPNGRDELRCASAFNAFLEILSIEPIRLLKYKKAINLCITSTVSINLCEIICCQFNTSSIGCKLPPSKFEYKNSLQQIRQKAFKLV